MPKQFLDILGTGSSFIRHTYERFLQTIPAENFRVVTNRNYRELVMEQIPELSADQILCEPIGRNTAPCICYAAYSIIQENPEAEMVVTPADHYVSDEAGLRSIVEECFDFVNENHSLLTVGIRPTRPETGYGYIQVTNNEAISPVKCFTEKPNLELAQTFINTGEFFWNSGIFIWRAEDIITAIGEYMPETHLLFESIRDCYGTEREMEAVARVFSECRSTSIDYGVMERAQNVYVRVGEFGWSDVGTWGSVYQLTQHDEQENIGGEESQLYNTKRSIISLPKGKISVISGLEDYIVVDTDDVLMICPRSEEQDIKRFVEDLKYNKGDKFI